MTISLFSIAPTSGDLSANAPSFPFAERLRNASSGFRFSPSGTFLVAPDNSQIPKFVFNFHCSEVLSMPQDSLRELLVQMNSVSSGFIWFDNEDGDSHALAMRTRLKVKVSAILYGITDAFEISDKPYTMKAVPPSGRNDVMSLLRDSISSHGGLDAGNLDPLLTSGGVSLVLDEETEVGVVAMLPLAGDFVSVGGVIKDGQQHRSVDVARAVLSNIIQRGKKPLYGVSAADEKGCAVAQALGLSPARFSYIAQLGDF